MNNSFGRIGGFFASGLLAISLLLPLAMAESRGIIITGDGDDINVTVDSSVVSDVQIKRPGGKMVIELPDDRLTGTSKPVDVVIDSALKQSSKVQIQNTPKGRIVTINTDRAFVGLQDLSEVTLQDAKKELSKPAAAKTAAKPVATKETPKPVATTTAAKPPEPKNPAVKPAVAVTAAKPVAQTATAAPKAEVKKAQPKPAVAATKPVEKKPLPKVISVEEVSTAPLFQVPEEVVVAPTVVEPVPAPLPQEGVTSAELGVPLAQIHQQQTSPINMGTIARVIASLTIVLIALAVFFKYLPTLVDKYPQFVAMLKTNTPISVNAAQREAQKPEAKNLPAVTAKTPALQKMEDARHMPSPQQDRIGKQAFLEHWGKQQDQFRILTSSKIGRGKELHLVEIKGHHLVVATTPFTVNFITELTEDGQPKPVDGTQGRHATLGDSHHSVITATEEPVTPEEEVAQTSTHAYLRDHLDREKPQDQIHDVEDFQLALQYAEDNLPPETEEITPAFEPDPEITSTKHHDEAAEFTMALPPQPAYKEFVFEELTPAPQQQRSLDPNPAQYWSEEDDSVDLYKKYLFPDKPTSVEKVKPEPKAEAQSENRHPLASEASLTDANPAQRGKPNRWSLPKKRTAPPAAAFQQPLPAPKVTMPKAASKPQPQLQPQAAALHQSQFIHPHTVDAAEVIVLEDYDDEYIS